MDALNHTFTSRSFTPADATSVRRPYLMDAPKPAPAPVNPPVDLFTTSQSVDDDHGKRLRQLSLTRKSTPMVADKTAVKAPVVERSDNRDNAFAYGDPKLREAMKNYQPRQETISSITPEQWERNVRYTEQVEAGRRNQEDLNRKFQLDPFAAGVNGYTQGVDGNVSKTGINPLEGVAMMAPLPRVASWGLAAFNGYKAVEDPSLGNLAVAGLSLFGAGAAERGRALEESVDVARTAARLKPGPTTSTNLKTSLNTLHNFESRVLNPVERIEGSHRTFELWHKQQEAGHEGGGE